VGHQARYDFYLDSAFRADRFIERFNSEST
jgi:hypothetical protein